MYAHLYGMHESGGGPPTGSTVRVRLNDLIYAYLYMYINIYMCMHICTYIYIHI
jgi:hypothetical protein